ncbi:MAG: ABC transporter permease [Treponema sp.]|jgi:peptide/nickel transport system permease protein|nr:ABC transporter permease [Treponema sp.]
MIKNAASTLLRMALLLLGVSLFSFILIVSAPIDPVTAFVGAESGVSEEQKALVAEYWGLDKPPAERFFYWLSNVLRGDMGVSLTLRRPVAEALAERALASLALMVTAWILSGVLGFILGVVCGANRYSLFDKAARTFCFVLSSTPVFWIGLLLLMFFSIYLGWFPLGLSVPIGKMASEVTIWDRIHHLILPALTLSITGVSAIALHTRQKLIDVLESDYALFARARGEWGWQLVKRHGLRNIAIPAVTLQFASFSELFGGSVLAETVFSYPGLGSAVSLAGNQGDVPLFLGVALFSALFVFVGNLTANILYGLLNPEIREGNAL